MSVKRQCMLTAVVLCFLAGLAWADRDPQIGFLFPAGAQRGTTTHIIVGGQYLNTPKRVEVSGRGVQARVVKYIRPLRNLNREQRYMFLKDLSIATEKRLKEADLAPDVVKKVQQVLLGRWTRFLKTEIKTEGIRPAEHYLLMDLGEQSLRELIHTRETLFFPAQKKQRNKQLEESVLVEITIAPDAQPGDRDLRLQTIGGLTNPAIFQVGQVPDTRELEPNDDSAALALKPPTGLENLPRLRELLTSKPLDLPVTINGQIMPGDTDRFRFRGTKGQKIVVKVSARGLLPYLADAVPGWFQATVALYDSKGNEIAFADDYRFKPDPVLMYDISQSGIYDLEIRDALYRGREDFVYRVSVGEPPFITRVFPLGGREGMETTASVSGWNLPPAKVALNTASDGPWLRKAAWENGDMVSNRFHYAVDTLPEITESEPNNSRSNAQPIILPMIINGRIVQPGDSDLFRIKGKAGDTIVAEVCARRLDSPLDSLVRLLDASGEVVKWNDDHVHKDEHLHVDRVGMVTHHADSFLMAQFPEDGAYYVQLSDARKHGSDAHAYRLRLSKPLPDFALKVTPSSVYALPGGIVPLTVYALRRDGFDGEIHVSVKKPPGLRADGGRIPAGRNKTRMTITIPRKAPRQAVSIILQGTAEVGGQIITRQAAPADDTMQAFLYRHLVPADDLLVAVRNVKWGLLAVEIASPEPVEIPPGGSAKVLVKTRDNRLRKEAVLVLDKAPRGISLHGTRARPEGIEFVLKADTAALKDGFTGNLIVEIFREYTVKAKNGRPAAKRRNSIGYLPAIPVKVMMQQKHAAK